MILTICIPIYNVDVRPLVQQLHQQIQQLGVACDIICMDDNSREEIKTANRATLQTLLQVSYIELRDNVGRAKIRNWLAKTATGTHLLYLDCDSSIVNDHFVRGYLDRLDCDIVYGGRHYHREMPAEAYRLHWRYGRRYEDRSLAQRLKAPTASFLSCNFMVRAAILAAYPFDEGISGYGYEDLVWAQDAGRAGYKVTHIENPVVHGILDDNDSFMRKTGQSICNLDLLYRSDRLPATSLIKWHRLLAEWQVDKVCYRHYQRHQDRWLVKLTSGTASLWLLQWYKLMLYTALQLETKR